MVSCCRIPGQLAACALVVIAHLSGCATTGDIEERLDGIDKELRDLRRSQALTAQRVREVDRLGQTTFMIQDGIEQMGLELEQIKSENRKLKNEVKILSAAVFDPDNPVAVRVSGTARREPQTRAPEPRAAAAPAEMDPQPAATDPRGMYAAAYESMTNGSTDNAVAGFEALLQAHPDSDLADNAHYWLGEVFSGLGDLDRSRRHFNLILDKYPGGNKVPDALYKLGVLDQENGDCAGASTWYRKVQEQYPWSPVSEKAQARMQSCATTE